MNLYEALDKAWKEDDLEKIKALQQEKPNVLLGGEYRGFAPLHMAVLNINLPVVNLLLAMDGIEPNIKCPIHGNTPLHYAAMRIADVTKAEVDIKLEIIKSLVAHKANPNIKNDWNELPLHHATSNSPESLESRDIHFNPSHNLPIVEFLLTHTKEPHCKNKSNYTPLHFAILGARHANTDVVKCLLQSGEEKDIVLACETINAFNHIPLTLAARDGDLAMIKALLEKAPNTAGFYFRGISPLHELFYDIRYQDSEEQKQSRSALRFEKFKLLWKPGVDLMALNLNGKTIFEAAERHDLNPSIVDFLKNLKQTSSAVDPVCESLKIQPPVEEGASTGLEAIQAGNSIYRKTKNSDRNKMFANHDEEVNSEEETNLEESTNASSMKAFRL